MRRLVALVMALAVLGLVPATIGHAVPATSHWTQLNGRDAGFASGSNVTSVAEFHGTLWAAGSVYDQSQSGRGSPPVRAMIWTSRDGHLWTPVENESPAPGSEGFGDGRFAMLVATSSALFGVVQFRHTAQSATTDSGEFLEVWSSTDGTHWNLATETAPGGIHALLATDHQLIGIGQTTTSPNCQALTCTHGAIWTSTDGTTWPEVTTTTGFPPGSYVSAVVPARSGFVAVGSTYVNRMPKPLVWSSADGSTWTHVQPLAGLSASAFTLGGLASDQAIVLDVGLRPLLKTSTSTTSPTTTTSTTTTTSPLTSGGSVGAVLCAQSTDVANAVWTTTTGRRWRLIHPRGLADDTTAYRVTNSHGQWLLAGADGDCSHQRTVVYQSSDGTTWQRAAAGRNMAVDVNLRSPTALTATSRGAILVVSPLSFMDETSVPEIWIESR